MNRESNIDKIYQSNLLIEQQWYFAVLKAKAVYRKCIRNKRFETAKKIALKYDLDSDNNSDHITAFGLAMTASNNLNNNNNGNKKS